MEEDMECRRDVLLWKVGRKGVGREEGEGGLGEEGTVAGRSEGEACV